MPALPVDVQDLHRSFGEVPALRGIDLQVGPGESVGLLGPNGAGKTTLLSILTGLRRADSGRAWLFGGSPTDPRLRARLGVTPQTTALPAALRVNEVVALVAGHYPDPVPTADILDQFGLLAVRSSQCGALSGGQQRRLLVALALVGRPRLVILDEPTTGLDLHARDALWDAVSDYRATGGSLLVTSHYLEDVERLTERVVVMLDGQIVTQGSLAEVRATARLARVRFDVDDTADLSQLGSLAGVVGVDSSRPGAVDLDTRDPDATVTALVHAGVAFRDLDVRPASLEDALRHLTGTRDD
ncbi:MAG: ABC transporter ATP-binding protein [Mobilicoccus sp.]|nr:ABC transporter ATP-binding protein [Mobilicoccus sp.]